MSPFRAPLDIRGYIANLGPESALERPEGRDEAAWGVTAHPFRWGAGEAECSSCTDLVSSPHVIFDVNGYYRALGFTFPYLGITRRQLRIAYLLNNGQNSIWLTEVMKTLLNHQTRREYDLTRLGDRYLDRGWQEWFARKAYEEARRRAAHGQGRSTKEQVLDDWGLGPEPPLDPGAPMVQDLRDPTDEGLPTQWSWSYYLWGSRSTDTDRLSRWQASLIRECNSREVYVRFCVGFSGRKFPDRWATDVIGQHFAFFLREGVEPTDELAGDAVSAVLCERDDEVRKDEPFMATPTFRRGGQQAEEAAKRNNKNFSKHKFFQIKEDKGTAVIRLIDDGDPESGWIYTRQHPYVPTKGPDSSIPEEAQKNWPKRMGAVCRYDDAFRGMYDDCYICDSLRKEDGKPFSNGIRLWARAVVREPVIGTEQHFKDGLIKEHMVGQLVGYKDAMVTETDEKGTAERPDVVILNFGMKNFFGSLQGYYDVNGTVLDRDFRITRKGMGQDTEYSIVARDPIPKGDGSGEMYDLRDPEIRAQYEGIVDLEEVIVGQTTDDYYARYFDPTKPIPARKEEAEGTEKAASAQPTPEASPADPSEDQMKAMRDRIKGVKSTPVESASAVNFG